MATKVKEAAGVVERILLPRLNSIDGELKSINTRIDSVDRSIGELDKRLTSKIDSNHSEIKTELRALHEKVNLLPRMAVLEAKMKELEKRS